MEVSRNREWGGLVVGQDKASTARYSTARTLSANPFGFSHGQRTVRAVSRGTDQPTPLLRPGRHSKLAKHRAFLRLTSAIAVLSVAALLIEICALEMRRFALVVTLTDSSCPAGIYRLTRRSVARGDLVEACLPDPIATYGTARGYLGPGDCPNHSEPVLKIVGALVGDRVELSRESICVNGILLPQSATLSRDSRSRAVETIARGPYQTAADQTWLFGLRDPRSWDSRYFGPVPIKSVLGVVEPVVTLSGTQSFR